MLAGVLICVVGLLVVAAVVWRLSRWMQSPDAWSGGSHTADAFGNFIDVFDPGRSRGERDLQEHHNAGPVTRAPDDEDEDPVKLIAGPDGRPRGVSVRRTARRDA
ncbi:MAG: hypothetical protein U0R80_10840 [Nocardioidaceae bacterium]